MTAPRNSRHVARRLALGLSAFGLAALIVGCGIDTSPGPPDAPSPGPESEEVHVVSLRGAEGVIEAKVVKSDGTSVFSLRYDPSDNQITVNAANESPVSFENASYSATPEGAKLAVWYLYRHSVGFRDQPGCDPPANFMTTVCLSHMCAVHDQCFFDNPDKESNPCVGSTTNFWVSVKNWAWGSADYCDACNVAAVGEALKNGMYGCELSGECEDWDCGCDAKQCTVDGSTVCLSSGDCHQLTNSP